MLLVGLLNHLLRQNFVVVVLFKYPIVLLLLNHYQLLFLLMVPHQKQIKNYLQLLKIISIFVQVSLFGKLLMHIYFASFDCIFFLRDLNLKSPIYSKTACYGHFGRPEFPWEKPKQLKLWWFQRKQNTSNFIRLFFVIKMC
jgi:hypothetical protein